MDAIKTLIMAAEAYKAAHVAREQAYAAWLLVSHTSASDRDGYMKAADAYIAADNALDAAQDALVAAALKTGAPSSDMLD